MVDFAPFYTLFHLFAGFPRVPFPAFRFYEIIRGVSDPHHLQLLPGWSRPGEPTGRRFMDKTEKNIAHVQALIDEAKAAGLDGAGWVASLGAERCCEGYNGIGPEFLKPRVRAKVTEHLSLFAPAALIHDLRYTRSDGSVNMFNFANWEFLTNCRRLADRAYPWWSWRRYRARLVADALHDFVAGPGGWAAWSEAYQKNLSARASASQGKATVSHASSPFP